MERVLKYINAMPFPFTMRHFQVFGESTGKMKDTELLSPESWDVLRATHPFFSISENRDEWLAACEIQVKKDGQDERIPERARDIVDLLRREGITHLFSVGSGGAALEYHLKKLMPELTLVCSDYAESTVARLKNVFLECDSVVLFDALTGDWKKIQEAYVGSRGAVLIYRIDAGLSDQEWSSIFTAMARAGIPTVLVIPTGTLTLLSVYNRKKRELLWFLKRVPVVFCGYVRTEKRFFSQWRPAYTERRYLLGGLKSYLLTKRGTSDTLSSPEEKG